MIFSSISSLKEMLKRPEMCILRTQLGFRMYQKLEFTQEKLAFNIQQQLKDCMLYTLPQTSFNVLKAGKRFICNISEEETAVFLARPRTKTCMRNSQLNSSHNQQGSGGQLTVSFQNDMHSLHTGHNMESGRKNSVTTRTVTDS